MSGSVRLQLPHVSVHGTTFVPRGVGQYHYSGCGCSVRPWEGDAVDWIWTAGAEKAPRTRHLRIGYLIPHHNVTGGMKMIIEQIRYLRSRGHSLKAVYRGPPGSPVLPPWADVEVDDEVLLATSDPWTPAFAGCDVAMVGYFTQLAEVTDVWSSCPAPVFYWEQGHEQLFGDHSSAADWDAAFHSCMHMPIALGAVSSVVQNILWKQFARVAPVIPNAIDADRFHPSEGWEERAERDARAAPPPGALADLVSAAMRPPVAPKTPKGARPRAMSIETPTPSRHSSHADEDLERAIEAHGGPEQVATPASPARRPRRSSRRRASRSLSRDSTASEKAARAGRADCDERPLAASPTPPPARAPTQRDHLRVLLVGNPALPFKNHSVALRALNEVHRTHPALEVVWMCQIKPEVRGTTFPVRLVVNPAQADVPRIYRAGFDVMLFTSVYEAWGRPPMEAMASGVPLVTSACHGVDMFCRSGRNCVVADPRDPEALARAVRLLADRPDVASALALRALRDVRHFTWDRSMAALEGSLYQIAFYLGSDRLGRRGSAALAHKAHEARAAHRKRLISQGLVTAAAAPGHSPWRSTPPQQQEQPQPQPPRPRLQYHHLGHHHGAYPALHQHPGAPSAAHGAAHSTHQHPAHALWPQHQPHHRVPHLSQAYAAHHALPQHPSPEQAHSADQPSHSAGSGLHHQYHHHAAQAPHVGYAPPHLAGHLHPHRYAPAAGTQQAGAAWQKTARGYAFEHPQQSLAAPGVYQKHQQPHYGQGGAHSPFRHGMEAR